MKDYLHGTQRHRAYQDTVDKYNALRVHADGEVPEKLIKERRPSESETTLEYRKKIYVPKTKNPVGKVIRSLSKIRRSPDWAVKYDASEVPARIIEEETLEAYCELNYPGHKSVTNWAFSVLLKNNCIDANAVVAIFPLNVDAAKNNQYYKPQAMIFNSPNVIFFEEGADYAVLQSSERSSLIKTEENAIAGKVFYVLTTTLFEKWEENEGNTFTKTQFIQHNIGKLPAFKVRAEFFAQKENAVIQESRLRDMIPSLDEAAREYSDLQAAVVQHMHPLFWYFSSKACGHCSGTGKVIDTSGPSPCSKSCTVCNGSGKIKFSPYAHLEVDPPKLGEQATPAPPAGYIGRDVEIMKLQDERVRGHLFDALAAINMQFMDQTPLNISGKGKEVDREELTNFVYSVAEDLVWTIDQVYYFTNEWRNSVVVPDRVAREAMLPQVAVPSQFDLLPADYLMDGVSKAKSAKVNPILIAAMEEDYANKAFYNNPELSELISAYYELDPLPAMGIDEKNAMLMNKGITQEDYIISCYIVPFVKRAINEDATFLSKPLKERFDKMKAFAKEKTTVIDAAEKLKQELQQQQMQQQQEQFNQGN